MASATHLEALKRKHDQLEKRIHEENGHAARDELAIRRLKEERLHLREEIERVARA